LLIVVSELSPLEHPILGSVIGTMPIEDGFALGRGPCGTDQRAEYLEHGFHWSLPCALYRIQLGLPARLDHGRKRGQCGDVPFVPLPPDSCTCRSALCWLASSVLCRPWGSPSRLLTGCPLRTRGRQSSFTTWQIRHGPGSELP
jgi:hypothetical protein